MRMDAPRAEAGGRKVTSVDELPQFLHADAQRSCGFGGGQHPGQIVKVGCASCLHGRSVALVG
jgi:hypothetical protein